jgi:hypothetical protein
MLKGYSAKHLFNFSGISIKKDFPARDEEKSI